MSIRDRLKTLFSARPGSERLSPPPPLSFTGSESPGALDQHLSQEAFSLLDIELLDAPTSEAVSSACHLQLNLLTKAVHLSRAALLVRQSDNEQFQLLHVFPESSDIQSGSFNQGAGLIGALHKGNSEVCVAPVTPGFRGIPYYPEAPPCGAVIALTVPLCLQEDASPPPKAVLFCERQQNSPWQEEEKEIIRATAKQLGGELFLKQRIMEIGRERLFFQKLCLALRELNQCLGLQSVFEATARLISFFVRTDLFAISLLEEDCHYTAFISGKNTEHLRDLEYDRDDGLVGHALKLNHALPARGFYNGPAPIFSSKQPLAAYGSLLILPLRTEEGKPVGALSIASKEEGEFTGSKQDYLNLIGDQVAIKIELAKAHDQLNKLANTDGLTELPNHRTFQHAFDVMLHRASRRQSPLTLIMGDIDFFKKVNDTYGHPFGDQMLQAVADILAQAVRKEDLAARYGGEEFALILENSDKEGALLMAERIREQIASLVLHFEDKAVRTTMSFGISSYPGDSLSKGELISMADKALYEAKREGRNKVVVWKG